MKQVALRLPDDVREAIAAAADRACTTQQRWMLGALRVQLQTLELSGWRRVLTAIKMLPADCRGPVFREVLACVRKEDSVLLPKEFRDWDLEQKAAWLDQNCPLEG